MEKNVLGGGDFMRGFIKKISLLLFCILISTSQVGCTVGEYKVFDFDVDDNGNQEFMLIGQRGPSGNIEETELETLDEEKENEDLVEKSNDMQKSDDLENIVGTSLKKGWTSTDNSILKGRNVSIKEDSVLFSINLNQDKEITISYDILLDEGEYSLVYSSPDNENQVLLQDDEMIHIEEKILFTQGQNQITMLSDNAVFKKINISITGIEVSDFE